MTHDMPIPANIIEAERRIRPYVPITPLFPSPGLSRLLGTDTWIKAECVGPLSAFKLRGAMNHMLAAPSASGAVTASTGNHGQGVAYAAQMLGRSADIFLPDGSPRNKQDTIAGFGATLHIGGRDLDDAKAAGQVFAAERALPFIDDGESPHVIAGAGTIGLEIAQALPKVDIVFAATGSASLAAGTALGLKAAGSKARTVAVSSRQTPCMIMSFHAKRAIEYEVTTICDCLNQRIPPKLALAAMIANVDDAIEVDDRDCLAAMHTALVTAHMLVEVGAAAALAGAHACREAIAGKTVVLIFSGANTDKAMLDRALATPPLA